MSIGSRSQSSFFPSLGRPAPSFAFGRQADELANWLLEQLYRFGKRPPEQKSSSSLIWSHLSRDWAGLRAWRRGAERALRRERSSPKIERERSALSRARCWLACRRSREAAHEQLNWLTAIRWRRECAASSRRSAGSLTASCSLSVLDVASRELPVNLLREQAGKQARKQASKRASEQAGEPRRRNAR